MLVGEIAYKMVGYRQPPPLIPLNNQQVLITAQPKQTLYTVFFLICECQKIVLMEIRLIGPFSPNNLFNQSFIDDSTNRPIILSIGPFPQDFFQSFRS